MWAWSAHIRVLRPPEDSIPPASQRSRFPKKGFKTLAFQIPNDRVLRPPEDKQACVSIWTDTKRWIGDILWNWPLSHFSSDNHWIPSLLSSKEAYYSNAWSPRSISLWLCLQFSHVNVAIQLILKLYFLILNYRHLELQREAVFHIYDSGESMVIISPQKWTTHSNP